eukprot:jgi/Psemu1/292510/fgenesh1_pg.1100_\
MVEETREHLTPPPYSYLVTGAGSKVVNGRYVLSTPCMLMKDDGDGDGGGDGGNGDGDANAPPRYRYYHSGSSSSSSSSSSLVYEQRLPSATTISLCRCDMSYGPTTSSSLKNSAWFLTQLDEEQPNTDCDTDYYYATPRVAVQSSHQLLQPQKPQQPQPQQPQQQQPQQSLPPAHGWIRRGHGRFPTPTVIAEAGGYGGGGRGRGTSFPDALAEWIVTHDVIPLGLAPGEAASKFKPSSLSSFSPNYDDEGIAASLVNDANE